MTLANRLWQYQAERFPLIRHGPLIAVFAAAAVTLSATLAGRDPPGVGTYASAILLALLAFFQLRVSDEVKDADDDRRFRPERPVPRGLVTLRLLVWLAVIAAGVQALIALTGPVGILGPLVLVWFWMGLMAVEFGVAAWLKARSLLYLVSHMAILPLIDLMLTACEWGAYGQVPAGLWPFLALSFANGCVIEFGRKIWAPEAERLGVETYSHLWGLDRALSAWVGTVVLAAGLMIATGVAAGAAAPIAGIALVSAAAVVWVAERFRRAPSPKRQTAFEQAAGVWVLVSYLALGIVPFALRGIA